MISRKVTENLGRDGEADPGADLVGVVGARAQVEQAR